MGGHTGGKSAPRQAGVTAHDAGPTSFGIIGVACRAAGKSQVTMPRRQPGGTDSGPIRDIFAELSKGKVFV